jgi:signal transduction histidine kinase
VVLPFWWETWWFRGAVLLAFTVGVGAIVRYFAVRRLRARLQAAEQETAVERERARIARDIHDDLGGRLTKIALLSGLAARDQADPARASAHVREIAETTRQLMQSLDETVWTVSPRNDSLPHLVSYVGQFAVNFLRTAEINCRLDLPIDPPPLPVGAEVRHHLLLAVKEALTNVVRHAGAREVRMRVEFDEHRIAFVVEDDGRGFTVVADAAGADGLRNMRQRMEQIGGIFRLDTGPGRGTRLTLGIPRAASAS